MLVALICSPSAQGLHPKVSSYPSWELWLQPFQVLSPSSQEKGSELEEALQPLIHRHRVKAAHVGQSHAG
jgi:hypothetical protein